MTRQYPYPVKASPRARRAMRRLGVEAARIRGSGPGGRIIEADVLGAPAADGARPVATSPTRRAIAAATSESFATIPHFYLRAEVDATELIALRESVLASIEKQTGVRVTLTDFLLAALARALNDYPFANRVWRDGLLELPCVDVGLLVATDEGLIAPVLRDAPQLELAMLAAERARLVDGARRRRLPADAFGDGAASLSNLGTSRADEFAAIILPHQSSMLAVGRAAPRPFVVNGQLAVRTTLRLCLSLDHRVLDGATGAQFLGRIVELLESPHQLAG